MASESEFLEYVEKMVEEGYTAFGLRTDRPTAFAGGYTLHCPWYEDVLWLVDLVVRPESRGQGLGSARYAELER